MQLFANLMDGRGVSNYFALEEGASYWKTCSSGTPNTWAIRKATSNEGEYLSRSMAMTVWRVTEMRSASSCCVIERAARSSRMVLRRQELTRPSDRRRVRG